MVYTSAWAKFTIRMEPNVSDSPIERMYRIPRS